MDPALIQKKGSEMKVKYVFSILALLIAPTFCNSQPEVATGRDLLKECQVVQRQ